jgi:cobalamin synthase
MSGTPRSNGVRQAFSAMREPGITKYAPLAGLSVGALSAAVYWLGTQLWPSSVALILAMLTGALLNGDMRRAAAGRGLDSFSQLFYVLLKYNVLMALSAAKLPFDAPPNTALCLIMICGFGAARSLLVCLLVTRGPPNRAPRMGGLPKRPPLARRPLSHLDLGLALLLGFAPALLLGMPGLIGLAAAIASIIGLSAAPRSITRFAPWIAETCFYLGAQASWSYV